MTEAGTREKPLQTKEHKGLTATPEARKRHGRFLARVSEGASLC